MSWPTSFDALTALLNGPHGTTLLSSPRRRRIAIAAVIFAALAAAGSAGWERFNMSRLTRLQSTAVQLGAQLRDANRAASAASAPGLDYVQSLPVLAAAEPMLGELSRSSAELGVVLVSAVSTAKPATEQTLGRIELAIALRGPYPAVKMVLAEALARYPTTLFEALTIRRGNAGTEVEAQVSLSLLSRPLALSTASHARE